LPLLAAALVFGVVLSKEYRHAGYLSFAMDDAWIHAAVARNLAQGLGFSINPHQPISCSTSPAWTVSLALFYLLTGGHIVPAALILSLFCTLGASMLVFAFLRNAGTGKVLALLGSLVMLLEPISLWGMASGMEIPMVNLVVMAVFWYWYRVPDPANGAQPAVIATLLFWAAMTRPELLILFPLCLLAMTAVTVRKNPDTWWKAPGLLALVFCALLLPYAIFNLSTTGHIVPATFYAKTCLRHVGLLEAVRSRNPQLVGTILQWGPQKEIRAIARSFLDHNIILAFFVPVGLVAMARLFPKKSFTRPRDVLLPATLILLPIAMGILTPSSKYSNYAHRYYAPFITMVAVTGVLGINFFLNSINAPAVRRTAGTVIVALALLLPLEYFQRTVKLLIHDVINTKALYVEMGKWIAKNIPPGQTVAVNDIGGVAYFCKHPILDIMGLASPEIWESLSHARTPHEKAEAIYRYICRAGIRYLAISPRYYPSLAHDRKRLEPIQKFTARYPVRRLIAPQIVYRVGCNTHRQSE